MSNHSSRREFLKASVAAAAVASLPSAVQPLGAVPAPTPKAQITKGLVYGMLPKSLSYDEQFKMAADAGFECVEAYTTPDESKAEQIKQAAESAGIKIHSVMNQAHWDNPLSSDDPAVVAKSMEGMRTSLRNAKLWGADAVLLVPAVVNPQTSYRDAWTRSQKQIRELIPNAKDLGIILDTARQYGIPLPTTSVNAQLFNAMLQIGMAELDNSAVIGVLETLANIHLLDE